MDNLLIPAEIQTPFTETLREELHDAYDSETAEFAYNEVINALTGRPDPVTLHNAIASAVEALDTLCIVPEYEPHALAALENIEEFYV